MDLVGLILISCTVFLIFLLTDRKTREGDYFATDYKRYLKDLNDPVLEKELKREYRRMKKRLRHLPENHFDHYNSDLEFSLQNQNRYLVLCTIIFSLILFWLIWGK